MIKAIIGAILLLIPFLLICKFKDKKLGFFYVLSFLIAGNLIIALITQSLGIFRYWLVLLIFIIADIFILSKINYSLLKEQIKKIKIDWIFVATLLIVFLCLYFIHFRYTGEIATINGNETVKSMRYPYPYFSDEWVTASLAKYSISSGKLPIVNSFWHNEPFPNLAFPFHSFTSQIFLLLGLEPAFNFYLMPLLSGLLICSLGYFILRLNNIGKFASSISALSILYIVNSAVLPGIWYFIPISMGLIGMLISLLFISLKNTKMALFASFLSLIFYPPLVVFEAVSLIFYLIFLQEGHFLQEDKKQYLLSFLKLFQRRPPSQPHRPPDESFRKLSYYKKKKTKFLIVCLAVFILIVLAATFYICLASGFSAGEAVKNIISRVYYKTIYINAIPNFLIYKIIPAYALVLAVVGVASNYKKLKDKLWLLAPIVVGLILWAFYSKSLHVFVIAYDRDVFITSLLIVLLSGFGINYFIERLRKIEAIRKYKVVEIIFFGILLIFFILSFSYTQRDAWKELKINFVESNEFYAPEPPANRYLHDADLELFKGIHGKNFLSLSWKGLVIGAATDNYPIVTKAATLTNVRMNPLVFYDENCENKLKIAKENQIDYVYYRKIECPGFELKGVSIEDLYLYKIAGDR